MRPQACPRSASRLVMLLLAASMLPAAAEPEPCTGGGDPFLAVPGFGAAVPLPTPEGLALARREGPDLVLAGDQGEIRLRDHPSCAEGPDQPDCVTHRLVAAFDTPRGFLVERGHYEHVDFLWISRAQGQAESMADLPRLSPGGRWLLSVSASDWMRLNGIEIFEAAHGGITRVWQHLPRGAPETFSFFAFWQWTGDESALLCAWRGSPPEMTGPEPVMLRRGAFGWGIEPPR